jgi:hypothetical protein
MQVPQPAPFFLGAPFEIWIFIFMAVLATYAVIVLARRKRQSFASLGDHESHEETDVEAATHSATAEEATDRARKDTPTPAVNSPSIANTQPETRR